MNKLYKIINITYLPGFKFLNVNEILNSPLNKTSPHSPNWVATAPVLIALLNTPTNKQGLNLIVLFSIGIHGLPSFVKSFIAILLYLDTTLISPVEITLLLNEPILKHGTYWLFSAKVVGYNERY